jgi:D-alanyl-D-alanine carboxypeptidase
LIAAAALLLCFAGLAAFKLQVVTDFGTTTFLAAEEAATPAPAAPEPTIAATPTPATEETDISPRDESIKLDSSHNSQTVYLNSHEEEAKTFLYQNERFLEAHPLLEFFGCVVFWNSETQTVAVNTRDGVQGVFQAGELEALINGEAVSLSSPALLIEEALYITAGTLDALVDLDSVTTAEKEIWIEKQFATDERNLQIKEILLQVQQDNYNPLNFADYLAFQKQNPDLPADQVVLRVNIGAHKEPYSDIQEVVDPNGVFAVIDKNHKLDDSFEPEDLAYYGGFLWKQEAGEAWLQMKSEAKAEGISLVLNNTYRSIAAQAINYNSKIRTRQNIGVENTNSRPGHSEHHTGYAADLTTVRYSNRKVDAWIAENAYKYGFIVSFQAGKEYINHYTPEPWHIRWFPLWAAEIMHEEWLTIQEFENLHLNPKVHGFETDKERAAEIAERVYSKLSDWISVAAAGES